MSPLRSIAPSGRLLFHIPHSIFYILHSIFHIPCSIFYIQHSIFHILHSTFHIPLLILLMCLFELNGYVEIYNRQAGLNTL